MAIWFNTTFSGISFFNNFLYRSLYCCACAHIKAIKNICSVPVVKQPEMKCT